MKNIILLFSILFFAILFPSCQYENIVDQNKNTETDAQITPALKVTMIIDQLGQVSYQVVNNEINTSSFQWITDNIQFFTYKSGGSVFNVYYTLEWSNCPAYLPVTAYFIIKNNSGTIIHTNQVVKTYGVVTGTSSKEELNVDYLTDGGLYQYQIGMQTTDEDKSK